MTDRPTREIETPVGKHKVLIKTWITGREREHIQEPIFGAINMTPRQVGANVNMEMQKMDMARMVSESGHRELSTFVVSVDGKSENVLDTILDMHEDDVAFIKAEIAAKKNEPAS
jgi:hypothetical protein